MIMRRFVALVVGILSVVMAMDKDKVAAHEFQPASSAAAVDSGDCWRRPLAAGGRAAVRNGPRGRRLTSNAQRGWAWFYFSKGHDKKNL